MRIALVVMPWVEAHVAPLGVAALKAALRPQGFEVDCHHLHLRMYRRAARLASLLYPQHAWAESFFARRLFGAEGSRELAHGLEEMLRLEDVARFLERERVTADDLRRLEERDIPSFMSECLGEVPWGSYGLIGFSSNFNSHTACLALAREIKLRHPRIPIVFGGANVEGPMGPATLRGCDWVDFTVDGEGEGALLELARRLASGGAVDGTPRLSWRRAGEVVEREASAAGSVDMDLLPTPDHSDFFAQHEQAGLGGSRQVMVTFEGSRGCWWGEKQHCTFCAFNGTAMAFRQKSAGNVVRDVLDLHRRHRARTLLAGDNIMSLDHLRRLLPLLKEARTKNRLDWCLIYQMKSNLTAEQLGAMAEAGVLRFVPGIESLSSSVLRLMRKGVSGIRNVQTIKLATAHGIEAGWNWLWGFPGEDPAEYDRLAEWIPALTHLQSPQSWGPIRVDRFSPYHFDFERLGAAPPVPDPGYAFVYPSSRFRLEEMAYFFHFADGQGGRASAYTAELAERLAWWSRIQHANYFAYARGMGFVELYDSRPFADGRRPVHRVDALAGLEAELLTACESARTLGELVEVARRAEPQAQAERVGRLLEGMVKRRWLLREDPYFLSLAVPLAALSARQRLLFEQLSLLDLVRYRPAQVKVSPMLPRGR